MRSASLVILVASGCFVDAVGGLDATDGSTSAATGSGAGSSASGPSSSSSGATGGGGETAVGGGGGRADCGDGIVEPPEACEDGNTAAGDGCTGCAFDAATCGDGVFQAGETCAPGDPDCTNCSLTGGTCSGAPALPVGATTQTLVAQSLPPFPNDCNVNGSTTKAFRFDVGAYPRGTFVVLTEMAFESWPAVWASWGCGSEVLAPCDSNGGPTAFVVTPVLAPGMVAFFGIADENDTGGTFTLITTPFRARWAGGELQAWDLSGGDFVYNSTFLSLDDIDGSGEMMSRAISPPVITGGLAQIKIGIHYGKLPGGTVRLVASTDGGMTYTSLGAPLPDADWTAGVAEQRPLALAGATEVRVGVELDTPPGAGQVWFDEVVVFEE